MKDAILTKMFEFLEDLKNRDYLAYKNKKKSSISHRWFRPNKNNYSILIGPVVLALMNC